MQAMNSKASAEDGRHRELLAASARGSREAFDQLYDCIYTPLVRFIYRYTNSEPLIEEVLNDTMLVIWQKAGTFRGESRVMTWVLGIASRRALKLLQRERRFHGAAIPDTHPTATADTATRLATLEALDWALQQLAPEQRLAIEMAYFHGMSCEEMAQVLRCPLNTAKTRLHYGRRKLREVFARESEPLAFTDLIDEVSR